MLQTARDANTPYPSDPVNLSKHIRLARITKVYDIDEAYPNNLSEYGNVEIMWLDALDPCNNKETIPCLTPGASWSRGSGIYRMPHINDVAAVFQLPNARPVIIGYLPKYLTQAITSNDDSPAELGGQLPALRSGEILLNLLHVILRNIQLFQPKIYLKLQNLSLLVYYIMIVILQLNLL